VALLAERGTFVVPTLIVFRRWCFVDELVNEPLLDDLIPIMPYHRHLKHLRSPIGRWLGRRYAGSLLAVPALSPRERARAENGMDRMGEMLRRLHASDVPIAAGTDTGNPSLVPGHSLHQEMAEMVRHGLPNLAVLASATSAGASLLGRDDLGRVRPGALADLLLIDGDPSRHIDHLDRIQAVMLGGRWVDRAELMRRVRGAAAGTARAS
jgi:imidazolonepropionase-like amidohydrolase